MTQNRLDIKIGFKCNNLCRFCVQGNKRYIYPQPPTEKVKEELDKGAGKASGVVFTGGEPTLRKDLFDLISHARELGYKTIQIQSNGRMFASKAYCKDAISAGATEFSPALHGPIPQLHDYLTRAEGSFFQTIKGIKNLKDLGQYVLTNTVITRSNFRNLPALAKLLVSLGVDQFQFAFVHPVGRAGENFPSIVPRFSIIAPYVMDGLDIGIEAGKIVCTEAFPYCTLPGYEKYIIESRIPDTRVVEGEATIENYKKYRIYKGKLKGQNCPQCKYFTICEGPWREYPEKFGFSEFKPVK